MDIVGKIELISESETLLSMGNCYNCSRDILDWGHNFNSLDK